MRLFGALRRALAGVESARVALARARQRLDEAERVQPDLVACGRGEEPAPT
jgi:hypothetical protein